MIVNYFIEEVYTKQLNIDDLGNVCIRCTADSLIEFYILTKTVLGKTSFITFGPVMPDVPDMLLNSFVFSHTKMDYNEVKLTKLVTNFINNTKNNITEAEVINEEEALEALPDLESAYKAIELEENNY